MRNVDKIKQNIKKLISDKKDKEEEFAVTNIKNNPKYLGGYAKEELNYPIIFDR